MIGPRSRNIEINPSKSDLETAKGALFIVAIRCPAVAKLKFRVVAITTPDVQFTWRSRSSSISTQQFSVAIRFARPPGASWISHDPHAISDATAHTASSSETSPSSSSVTQMRSIPSI